MKEKKKNSCHFNLVISLISVHIDKFKRNNEERKGLILNEINKLYYFGNDFIYLKCPEQSNCFAEYLGCFFKLQ